MAKVGKAPRNAPMRPVLAGARNWGTAQLRAASYSRRNFLRLVGMMAALIAFLLFLGLWMGGLLPNVQRGISDTKRNTLMDMGFVVERVDVLGEGRLDERAVRRALGTQPGDYFFDLDMRAAQARVQSLPWVDHVVVRRLWPDRVVVQILEKRPYALWQDQGQLKLVDRTGSVIGGEDAVSVYADAAALPHIVGAGANLAMGELDIALRAAPGLNQRIASSVRVGDRWDLITHEGTRIQLPTGHAPEALGRLFELHARTGVLDRRVAVIDLRLGDRIGILPEEDDSA